MKHHPGRKRVFRERGMGHRGERGITLVESLIAMFLLTLTLFFVLAFEGTSFELTHSNQDRTFAIQKAIHILNELKAYVGSGMENQAQVLDSFDDGIRTDAILTIDEAVADPADPLSGNNLLGDGDWKYRRRITVRKLPNESSTDVRYVTVRIYAREAGRDGDGRVLADISSVIRTIGYHFPSTQVLDTYLIGIENVPGWWVYMATIQPLLENAISDIQARNPGLRFRTHWITSLSYGRDQEYLPYVNEATDSRSPIDHVYFYPGKMPFGSAVSFYYPTNRFRGRVNVDDEVRNGYEIDPDSPDYNPHPYAMADQFNHSMRYYDELALFNSRVAAGIESEDRPTLRLFLEQMYQNPEKFQNAIIINLHGELMPLPPLRNYSDPAKDPVNHRGVRVVTHPTQLRYENGDDLQLRVYSYKDGDTPTNRDVVSEPISILIRDVFGTVRIDQVSGGVDPVTGYLSVSPDHFYEYEEAPTSPDFGEGYGMFAPTPVITADGVLIKLYNSPLVSPDVEYFNEDDGMYVYQGLADRFQPYGREYVPCPITSDTSFPAGFELNGLEVWATVVRPRNTARWVITVPSALLPPDGVVTVETRIGDNLNSGQLYPTRIEPSNLSRTYAWRGVEPPITERFQYQGDPRHCPYQDLHNGSDVDPDFYRGYNRYFCRVEPTDWPWLADTATGWGVSDPDQDLDFDVPRMFQTVRDANFFATTLFTTMTGYSFYYVGLGGEIGYDESNNFPNSIPVSMKPYNGSGGSGFAQEISGFEGNARGDGAKIVARSNLLWYAKPWLGELYRDDDYAANWADAGDPGNPRGNLPTGPGNFRRVLYSSLRPSHPRVERFAYDSNKRPRRTGAASFFNSTGGGSGPFNHFHRDGTNANIQTDGQEISTTFNFPMPSTFSAFRPFQLDAAKDYPPEFNTPPYSNERALMEKLQTFYLHADGDKESSSLLKLDHHSGDYSSFLVMNGLSPSGNSGTAWLARYTIISLMKGFLGSGSPSLEYRIPQLPRVVLTRPRETDEIMNPSSLTVDWNHKWLRWDGEKYTSDYPSDFSESNPVSFRLLYSDDGGGTWRRIDDGEIVEPGVRPEFGEGLTSGPYEWNVPSSRFPEGNYILRIEAYRDDIQLHYSLHQKRVFLRRSSR